MKGAWDFHACSSCASARKSNLSDGDASVHGGDLLARVPFLAHGGICPLPPFLFFYFVLASFSGQYLGSTVAVTYHSYLGLVCNAEIVFGYHPQHMDQHSHAAKSYRACAPNT